MKLDYQEFKYLYPPRPENIISHDRIPYYEKTGWVAQYKKNGTNTIIACSPTGELTLMNRHFEKHKAWQITSHLKDALAKILPKGSWTVLTGEILHNKTPTVKDTLFIHEVLVYESKFLLGTTFLERQKILEKLLPGGEEKYSHFELTPKLWRAKLLTKDLEGLFLAIKEPKIDEGLVLKKPDGILKFCDTTKSNAAWQIKVRYPAKNYSF